MNRWEKLAQERLKEINLLKKELITLKVKEKELEILQNSKYIDDWIENKIINQNKDYILLKETIKKLTKKLEQSNLKIKELENNELLNKNKCNLNNCNNVSKYKNYLNNIINSLKNNKFIINDNNIVFEKYNEFFKLYFAKENKMNTLNDVYLEKHKKIFKEFEEKIDQLQLEIINSLNFNIVENKEEFLVKKHDLENMKISFELQIIYLEKKLTFLKGENDLLNEIINNSMNNINIDDKEKLKKELILEKNKNLFYNKKLEEFYSDLLNLNSKYIN